MKIKIGKYSVTIFEVNKLENANLTFDKAQAKAQAREIIESENFKALKKQAEKARMERNTLKYMQANEAKATARKADQARESYLTTLRELQAS